MSVEHAWFFTLLKNRAKMAKSSVVFVFALYRARGSRFILWSVSEVTSEFVKHNSGTVSLF